ncbi:MAG: hypothetical protein MPJ24_07620 [Pirellulaceae bacterium]|nr:hypothetical protein [Pirellulaceae bacterium]
MSSVSSSPFSASQRKTGEALPANVVSCNGSHTSKEQKTHTQPVRHYHRIQEVRKEQGTALRTVARNMKIGIKRARYEELPTTNLDVEALVRWQKVLKVPLDEMLEESHEILSRPVQERAQLVRMMKTVVSMQETAETAPLQRMVQTLIDQFIELMPELAEVTSWHSLGQRRSLKEYGRVALEPISTRFLEEG